MPVVLARRLSRKVDTGKEGFYASAISSDGMETTGQKGRE